jgi:hypothetical protein
VRIERTESARRGGWGPFAGLRHDVHIVLPLHAIEHLFTAPDLDPFDAEYETYAEKPGIEVIATALRAEGWDGKNAATLVVPGDEVTPTLEQGTREAVARYCRTRIADLRLELQRVRRFGIRALLFGAVAVLVLNLAAWPISDSGNPLIEALSQGLQVASWVTLWLPINLLVYDRWYYRRDLELYRAILHMEIRVVPDRARPPAPAGRSRAPSGR